MTFEEIISKIRERDPEVTQCFFFWDGPTQQYIDDVRRTDPERASTMRRPVCSTCRPGLLRVLHSINKGRPFNYEQEVAEFYFYLMKDDKLAGIRHPEALMGWVVQTAYFYFLKKKKREMAEMKAHHKTVTEIDTEIVEDITKDNTRDFVKEVLEAMPNRGYARILDDVVLESSQHAGQERAEFMRCKAEEYGVTMDNLYVKISLAKKQFRKTAETIINENGK